MRLSRYLWNLYEINLFIQVIYNTHRLRHKQPSSSSAHNFKLNSGTMFAEFAERRIASSSASFYCQGYTQARGGHNKSWSVGYAVSVYVIWPVALVLESWETDAVSCPYIIRFQPWYDHLRGGSQHLRLEKTSNNRTKFSWVCGKRSQADYQTESLGWLRIWQECRAPCVSWGGVNISKQAPWSQASSYKKAASYGKTGAASQEQALPRVPPSPNRPRAV